MIMQKLPLALCIRGWFVCCHAGTDPRLEDAMLQHGFGIWYRQDILLESTKNPPSVSLPVGTFLVPEKTGPHWSFEHWMEKRQSGINRSDLRWDMTPSKHNDKNVHLSTLYTERTWYISHDVIEEMMSSE